MSMDLEQGCPHCEAVIGEICLENCEVNGKKIKKLKGVLNSLGLTMNNITVEGEGANA